MADMAEPFDPADLMDFYDGPLRPRDYAGEIALLNRAIVEAHNEHEAAQHTTARASERLKCLLADRRALCAERDSIGPPHSEGGPP